MARKCQHCGSKLVLRPGGGTTAMMFCANKQCRLGPCSFGNEVVLNPDVCGFPTAADIGLLGPLIQHVPTACVIEPEEE